MLLPLLNLHTIRLGFLKRNFKGYITLFCQNRLLIFNPLKVIVALVITQIRKSNLGIDMTVFTI
jgi:hypothetical protein